MPDSFLYDGEESLFGHDGEEQRLRTAIMPCCNYTWRSHCPPTWDTWGSLYCQVGWGGPPPPPPNSTKNMKEWLGLVPEWSPPHSTKNIKAAIINTQVLYPPAYLVEPVSDVLKCRHPRMKILVQALYSKYEGRCAWTVRGRQVVRSRPGTGARCWRPGPSPAKVLPANRRPSWQRWLIVQYTIPTEPSYLPAFIWSKRGIS
jgi:hypothetical protein